MEGASAEHEGGRGLRACPRPLLIFPSHRLVGLQRASTRWRPRSKRGLGRAERKASANALSRSVGREELEFEGKRALQEVKPHGARGSKTRGKSRTMGWRWRRKARAGGTGQSTPGLGNVRDGERRQGRAPGSRRDREGSARRISDVKNSSLLNKYPRAFQRGPVLQSPVPLQLPLFF